jgi:predicted 2-oxoglutarate/Fe(II)-dependent dioxygenase YbiX
MSLRVGDRVPNFQLPSKDGLKRIFYFEVKGGPIILLIARGPTAAINNCFAELASCMEFIDGHGGQVFGITDDCSKVKDNVSPAIIFEDAEGGLSDLLMAVPNGTPSNFKILILDPNQRVVAQFLINEPRRDINASMKALDRILNTPRSPAMTMQYGAPALLMDNLIDEDLCNRLIEGWKNDHQEGQVNDGKNNAPDASIKKNREHVVRDLDLRREIASTIGPRIMPELEKAFNFEQRLRFEAFTILSYSDDREDFFAPHRDNLRNTQKRRFAMSLNLNDGYEGGELWFPEYGKHKYLPAAGSGVIFSCSLLHEALPVTKGQRWVMVTFMCD